jgi:hypothetical protein
MSNNQFNPVNPMDETYGVCPLCNQPGVFRDTGEDQFICCDRHKLKWHHEFVICGGKHNVRENRALLRKYRIVGEPYLWYVRTRIAMRIRSLRLAVARPFDWLADVLRGEPRDILF